MPFQAGKSVRKKRGLLPLISANPPYYAQGAIARLFVERAKTLLRPGGRLYLVTKQADQIGPLVAEVFGTTEIVERRGYAILCARTKGTPPRSDQGGVRPTPGQLFS
jgi:16S rRNA G1207 methylase RsmC